MKHYVVYDKNGVITRYGVTSGTIESKRKSPDEFIIEGLGSENHKVVNGKVVKKTDTEIAKEEKAKRKPVADEKCKEKRVTNEQYDDIITRLEALENKET